MSEDYITEAPKASKIKRTEFTEELMNHLWDSLDYNPTTGDLIWKIRPLGHFRNGRIRNQWNSRYSGKPAGCPKKHESGCVESSVVYFRIGDRRMPLTSHRVAYSLAVRPLRPHEEVDHEDRNPLNNKLSNLRLVTRSQNLHNVLQKRRRGNRGGLPKGVTKNGNSFSASIMVNKKRYHLGSFPTPEYAHEAYKSKSVELMGEHSAYFSS